ncbi:MAG: cytochrome P460 family protein [Rhodothalassiaceae bacterium]
MSRLPLFAAASALAAVAVISTAAMAETLGRRHQAKFERDGAVNAPAPEDYRSWVYVGTPLTPNALNGGEAAFPEFHNVYVEPAAYKHYKKTGEWADGTQIVKELVTVRESEGGNNANGSSNEVSGTGYFQGEFNGLELAVKDTDRFGDEPGGWAYFSFGHHAPPYAETAKAMPTQACNSCHEAQAATDFVFTQFYPVLRAAD